MSLRLASSSLSPAVLRGLVFALVCGACASPASASPLIERVWTDKAQYRQGDAVVVSVRIVNATGAAWGGDVWVRPRFLGRSRGLDQRQALTVANTATQTLTFTILADSPLDRGYLAEVVCVRGDGAVTDAGSTSFDFAADWTKFPRYGFLTQFNADTIAADMIDPLRDYKINAVQYYDWMDEHHVLYRDGHEFWQDIAARDPWVSRAKLNELIARGHGYNMAAMAYDLMYGAYDDYLTESDVSLAWGAFTRPLDGVPYTLADQDRHELNIAEWETQRLYVFNPRSQGWRDWMGQQWQNVFADIAFDGWHIDTLGDRGQSYAIDGSAFEMAATYAGFVNDMRGRLGEQKRIVVNTVGNYGLAETMQSGDVDAIYTELWDGADADEFFDLKVILDNVRASTSKNAVIAGYVNYNAAAAHSPETPGLFNPASVLLADAAIFANGGWHIELGDGLRMLSNEYFPHQALVLSNSTQAKLLDYYNFAVAYENLLRDGVVDGGKRIDFDAGGVTPSGYGGAAGEVWKLSGFRQGLGCAWYYDIAHLINLTSVGSTLWRDPNSTSTVPAEILNKPVRLYHDGSWDGATVWYASPDYDHGQATEVTAYTVGFDAEAGQAYVEFTLPRLKYWTMIWLERRPSHSGDGNCDGVVDWVDFDEFAACMCGPCGGAGAGAVTQPCLSTFDFDDDGDVDCVDFAALQVRVGAG